MKTKVLNKINALLAFLMGVLGFSACEGAKKYGPAPDMYGTPYATLEVTGTVTDKEDNQPLKNIRVSVKPKGDTEYYMADYTNEDGIYKVENDDMRRIDSVDIIAMDTACLSLYASDTVRVAVEYDPLATREDNWFEGAGIVHKDFQLKKK